MSTLLSPSSRSRPTSPIKPPSPLKPPAAHASPRGGSQHPRQSSGVYSTFSTKQIQGFKEAFNMLDEDSNGLISRNDLRATLRNLGGEDSEAIVKRYFDSAIGGQQSGINFTQFLTMFGEHLNEMDEAPTLREAFECFDEKDDGVIDTAELRLWLSEVGDKMTDDEVGIQAIDRLLSGPFMDRAGKKFDYRAFVEAVKMSEPAELE